MTVAAKVGCPVKRTKYLFDVLNGATPASGEPAFWDGDVPWATPDDIGKLSGSLLTSTRRSITKAGYESCGTHLAPVGSIVLTTRAPVGNLAIAGVPLCTNQGCKTLVPRDSHLDTRFFYYQLAVQTEELGVRSTGTTFVELGTDELCDFPLFNPPLPQQREIAEYLDRETGRLDGLVAAKERVLGLLAEKRRALITRAVTLGLDPHAPLRDSGIPWLGEIPAHWETPPVYSRFEVQLGKMLDEKKIKGTHLAPYLRNVDVQWGAINTEDLPEMDFDDDDRVRYSIRSGDILVCEGGELGRCAIWEGRLAECYYQKALHRLRSIHGKDEALFFVLVMRTLVDAGVFSSQASSATIQHLPAEKLRVVRYPSPPLSEQRAIVAHIAAETANLDALRSATERTIALLKEHRSALIADAVTGKYSPAVVEKMS